MSITHNQFIQQCEDFLTKCGRLNDNWTLSSGGNGLMLVKKEIKVVPPRNELQNFEYTVIYNESYEVPVMYFNASNPGRYHQNLVSRLQCFD